ncbi:major capsid protein [Fusobacterium sp.]|uniref:major capsid protein n=1 Tax=Fusobacterium sp. TaxID=68766 RepID=UPI0028FE1EBE|nr:major capsid protein [Fusobacterium sp.]MDU1911066.1 major capsid protein [Fusobacterium sp.]
MPGINDIYTTKTVRKIRDKAELKRNFLISLFFPRRATVTTEEIILECTKSGEQTAPFITPLESGRAIKNKKVRTNVITAPNIGVAEILTPKDFFIREAGMQLSGEFDPVTRASKRVGEILRKQENYIVNKEELMVGQFLTSGKVTSLTGEDGYEVDYELENISTLPLVDQWGKPGVNPLTSLDEIISNAEASGVLVGNIVMGVDAAKNFMNNEYTKEVLSKDLQSEFVKEVIREYPGVVWLGTYKTYGVEIFRYKRKVLGPDKKTPVEIIPSNIVIGGPKDGEILYAPIVNMGKSDIHVTVRYSSVEVPTPKVKKITTESRPVLQPSDLDGYFSVIVC